MPDIGQMVPAATTSGVGSDLLNISLTSLPTSAAATPEIDAVNPDSPVIKVEPNIDVIGSPGTPNVSMIWNSLTEIVF